MMFGVEVGIGVGVGFCGDIIGSLTKKPIPIPTPDPEMHSCFVVEFLQRRHAGTAWPVGVARPKAVG
jgi:hypothetical protein